MVQQLKNATLDRLRHDVFPTAGLSVNVLPLHAYDVGQEAFGKAVLAHHSSGGGPAFRGELEMPVALHPEQTVTFHACNCLADRGATLLKAFGDPGTQRNDALLLQLEDGSEVHLGGVDQVAHAGHSSRVRLVDIVAEHRVVRRRDGCMPGLHEQHVPAR